MAMRVHCYHRGGRVVGPWLDMRRSYLGGNELGMLGEVVDCGLLILEDCQRLAPRRNMKRFLLGTSRLPRNLIEGTRC